MDVKEERLQSEYETIKKWRSDVVSWKSIGDADPPEHYEIFYNLKSIIGFDKAGEPIHHTGFKVLIKYDGDIPRVGPVIRFDIKTKPWPFHPNIWTDGVVCTEGTVNWLPGTGVPIDSICQMVGEIIAFQEVNINSPANTDEQLTTWVEKNLVFENGAETKVRNPVDNSTVRLPDSDDVITWGDEDDSSHSEKRIVFGDG